MVVILLANCNRCTDQTPVTVMQFERVGRALALEGPDNELLGLIEIFASELLMDLLGQH